MYLRTAEGELCPWPGGVSQHRREESGLHSQDHLHLHQGGVGQTLWWAWQGGGQGGYSRPDAAQTPSLYIVIQYYRP